MWRIASLEISGFRFCRRIVPRCTFQAVFRGALRRYGLWFLFAGMLWALFVHRRRVAPWISLLMCEPDAFCLTCASVCHVAWLAGSDPWWWGRASGRVEFGLSLLASGISDGAFY